jgi:hypothetical protein
VDRLGVTAAGSVEKPLSQVDGVVVAAATDAHPALILAAASPGSRSLARSRSPAAEAGWLARPARCHCTSTVRYGRAEVRS